MDKPIKYKEDIPLPIAFTALVIVIISYYLMSSNIKTDDLIWLNELILQFQIQLLILLLSIIINLSWVLSIMNRVVGLRKQGSRLKKIMGSKSTFSFTNLKPLLFSLLCSVVGYWYFDNYVLKFERSVEIPSLYTSLIQASLTMCVFIIILTLARTPFIKPLFDLSFNRLPRFPKTKDGVVLGVIHEEGSSQNMAKWISIPKVGLNGNILITGSIGSGKTQGTVLPYLDQIFANFTLNPSMLIIDPKRSFVPNVINMAEKHGRRGDIIHLKLDGKVTINPVYQKDALTQSRFLDTAHMFQAAAINFMGRSSDSPFWTVSSFNLIKNTVIYCAAVYDYYTLEDIYKVMITANDQDISDLLLLTLDDGNFNEEEAFNIKSKKDNRII